MAWPCIILYTKFIVFLASIFNRYWMFKRPTAYTECGLNFLDILIQNPLKLKNMKNFPKWDPFKWKKYSIHPFYSYLCFYKWFLKHLILSAIPALEAFGCSQFSDFNLKFQLKIDFNLRACLRRLEKQSFDRPFDHVTNDVARTVCKVFFSSNLRSKFEEQQF